LSFVFNDSGNIRKELILPFYRNQVLAAFYGKYYVEVYFRVCVSHYYAAPLELCYTLINLIYKYFAPPELIVNSKITLHATPEHPIKTEIKFTGASENDIFIFGMPINYMPFYIPLQCRSS
jgi:hypothetical protein